MVFLALPLPNSIRLKFTAVVQNAAPGRALRGVAWHGTWRHGTAQYGMAASTPPASLPPRWHNMRSLLLWPISFCIFGMCSPWRKSTATVWTVHMVPHPPPPPVIASSLLGHPPSPPPPTLLPPKNTDSGSNELAGVFPYCEG